VRVAPASVPFGFTGGVLASLVTLAATVLLSLMLPTPAPVALAGDGAAAVEARSVPRSQVFAAGRASTESNVALTYQLVDTWADVPRNVVAGRFGNAIDITSAPDGTVYVLAVANELRQGVSGTAEIEALHTLAPDGTPLRLIPLRETFSRPLRVDCGFDGSVFVLGQLAGPGAARWGVARYSASGLLLSSFPLSTSGTPADVAVAPDGRVHVSMAWVQGGFDQIDAYEPDGTLVRSLVPSRMEDGPDQRFSYDLTKLLSTLRIMLILGLLLICWDLLILNLLQISLVRSLQKIMLS